MPSPAPANAVIRFDPDGYEIARSRLMGRQMAGHGFLRAAVQGRGDGPVCGYGTPEQSSQAFARMVRAIDPDAQTVWIRGERPDAIGRAGGVLYLADSRLAPFARQRLRAGPARYSLCGVTHTTASADAMDHVAGLFTDPAMPWDALVCTSTAVADTVRCVLDAQREYLGWRLGKSVRLSTPQLPIIPLGVHCADFDFSDADRSAARAALAIEPDEIAMLYVGRLTFGKAHPFQMYQGLQAAAARTGRRLVLILCGWTPTAEMEETFTRARTQFAPDVRLVRVDGRDPEGRRNCWAAGDVFISLSDGIQETLGLTPIEAMAARLPVVVSDWNGYKDTVRDGIDGFRIPTWAPAPGAAGAEIARLYEADRWPYDAYLWAAASSTAVDVAVLTDCLATLIKRPDLRRQMGDAGRERALSVFEWAKVFAQYQALWGELNARRLAAEREPEESEWVRAAPAAGPSRLDPFAAFGHYPTAQIGPTTVVSLAPGATEELYRERLGNVLFPGVNAPERFAIPMLGALRAGDETIATLGAKAGLGVAHAALVVGTLAKMGLVHLRRG